MFIINTFNNRLEKQKRINEVEDGLVENIQAEANSEREEKMP